MSRFENLSKFQRTILLSSIVLLIGTFLFAVAEAGVRIRQYLKYGGFQGIENTYMVDKKSNLRIPIPSNTTGPVSINSLGFRGPEISKKKPKNTFRLAFLGASTTYCAEVSSNDLVWTDLVTRKFQKYWPEKQFDYVNGGVPGYGVNTSLRNLKLRVSPLRPDAIFIYHSTNDLSSNTRQQAKLQGLVSEESQKNEGLTWFSKHSLLSYLVEKNLRVFSLQRQRDEIQVYLRYEVAEIIRPFERDLRKLVDESKKTAKFVALITFSHRIRAEQSPDERTKSSITSLYYMPYMSVDGILEGFNAYNDVIRRIAHEKNVYLIDENNSIPGDDVHFIDSVHFTDRGSQKMADRIFERVIQSRKYKDGISNALSPAS